MLMQSVSKQIQLLQGLKISDSTTPTVSGSGNQLLYLTFLYTLGFSSIWESMLSPMSMTTGILIMRPAQFITLYEILWAKRGGIRFINISTFGILPQITLHLVRMHGRTRKFGPS